MFSYWYYFRCEEHGQRLFIFRFIVTSSVKYAALSLKNCVRRLIGRKSHFDERGLFLQQYVLHLTGLRPILTITCICRTGEGAGSQALMIMNAINFARSSGLTYVHTPFAATNHAEQPMQEWVSAWETLFNLGAGELICDAGIRRTVNYCHNFRDIEGLPGWRDRRSELDGHFSALVPEFSRKYYRNSSPRATEEVMFRDSHTSGRCIRQHLLHSFHEDREDSANGRRRKIDPQESRSPLWHSHLFAG